MDSLFKRVVYLLKKLPIFSFDVGKDDSLTSVTMDQIKSKLKAEMRPSVLGMVIASIKLLYENRKTGLVVYQINTSINNRPNSGDLTSWGRYLIGDLSGFVYSENWMDFEQCVYFEGVTEADENRIVIHHKGMEAVPGTYKVNMMRDVILDKKKFSTYTSI